MFDIILLYDGRETKVATINGCEVAWAAFMAQCHVADIIGADCLLVEADTGEIVGGCLRLGAEIPMPTAEDLAEAWWEG